MYTMYEEIGCNKSKLFERDCYLYTTYFLVANKVGNGIICTFLKSKSISILNSQFITLLIKESKKLFRTQSSAIN